MDQQLPLLVFETNILVDIWLGRGDGAVLLLELGEQKLVDLILPEYVLIEFRGTALRHLRDERVRLTQQVRSAAKDWSRSSVLGEGADLIRAGCKQIEDRLDVLAETIAKVDERLRSVATVEDHTPDIHFRGDLRFLSGRLPDRPRDGIKDCRIYEALLDIAAAHAQCERSKYFITRDSDFWHDELKAELSALGFAMRNDPGRLYGELQKRSPASRS